MIEQTRKFQTMGDLMREEEEVLAAEANTPERIAADNALFERNRRKMAAELESLRRQGMIDEGGGDQDEDEDEDEGEGEDTEGAE